MMAVKEGGRGVIDILTGREREGKSREGWKRG